MKEDNDCGEPSPARPASMIYAVRSHDAFVYHYTNREAAKKILADRTLLLGKYTKTKDPQEYRDWSFSEYTKRQNLLDRDRTFDLSERIKGSARLACFCTDRGPLTGDHTLDILNRGLARPRMWAQYGEANRGVCLVFDKGKLTKAVAAQFTDSLVLCEPVRYRNKARPIPKIFSGPYAIDLDVLDRVGIDGYTSYHLRRHARALFFEKLEDWRDEAEWRLLVQQYDGDLCLLEFGDALIGVVHGTEMSRADSDSIIDLADEPGVQHMGLLWNNDCPWYDLGGQHWYYDERRYWKSMAVTDVPSTG
jgi:hypothetical protein